MKKEINNIFKILACYFIASCSQEADVNKKHDPIDITTSHYSLSQTKNTITPLNYGYNIKDMDVRCYKSLLDVSYWDGFFESCEKDSSIRPLYEDRINYMKDFLDGNIDVLNPESHHNDYDLPFRLALFAGANAPKKEGRYLKDNDDWKTREYTITPSGVPSLDDDLETCTFVDAPLNNDIGDHLLFKGKGFEGLYNISNPRGSWIEGSSGCSDKTLENSKISGKMAVTYLKKIMESYKDNLVNILDKKLEEAKTNL